MSSLRTPRSSLFTTILIASVALGGTAILSAGCGGDTIGDNFSFLDGAAPNDATVIADTGTPDTSVVTPPPDGAPACTSGTLCGAVCADTTSDGKNCGGCGNVCGASMVCNAGACALSCSDGTLACGSSCVNPLVDVNNCGGCGTKCSAGLVCSAGKCGLSCGAGLTQCGGGSMVIGDAGVNDAGDAGDAGDSGAIASDGGDAGAVPSLCVDVQTDRGNCGGCGITCGAGQVCSDGACAASCQAGLVQCGQSCIDPLTNGTHCGATDGCGTGDGGTAGNVCPGGQVCSAGTCQVTCAANQVLCGTGSSATCVDPKTNGDFCGAAGNCTNAGTGNSAGSICPSGQFCNGNGVCAITCQVGQVLCGTQCVDPTTNGNFCGATAGCGVGGGSAGKTCVGGQICTTVGGVASCQVSCAQGQVLCNGVCIDPNTNANFCGATTTCTNHTPKQAGDTGGTNCASTPGTFCNGGTCTTTCQANEVLCGTGASATCIDPKTNETFCGAAGDCLNDGKTVNGVADSKGTACQVAGQASNLVCSNGACATSCPTGYVVCNGVCTNPVTDNNHCNATAGCGLNGQGSSGTVCGSGATAGEICQNSACTPNCNGNLKVCGTLCVDEQNDPNHCGGCTACAARNNVAEQDCISGSCSIGICATGTTDCNGFIEDGCEVSTGSDVNNCGACGNKCATGSTCNGGTCNGVATSCATALAANPHAVDGVYNLQPAGVATPFAAYCDMTRDGGGWTLILKTNGDTTFAYGASYWTDGSTLNANDTTLASGNAKFASFNTVPMTTLRGELGTVGTSTFRYTQAVTGAPTASTLFAGGEKSTRVFGAFANAPPEPPFSIQPYCHYFGINQTNEAFIQTRFGWSGNQDAPDGQSGDCGSSDSVTGFGINYQGGEVHGAGYDCQDTCDHGDQNLGVNGFLWVQ